MSGIISRLQSPSPEPTADPAVFVVGSDDANSVLDALSSDTSRRLIEELFDQPGTSSELAERADTSVQNVHYHLSKLSDAGLVESVGTRYSEKGYEMTVYGPTHDPVVFVGDEEQRPTLDRGLTDLLAGIGLLAAGSLVVQVATSYLVGTDVRSGVVDPASIGGGESSILFGLFDLLEPGVVFFFGTLLIVAAVLLWEYRN